MHLEKVGEIMNSKLKKTLLAVGVLASVQLFAGVAFAAPPANIVGTWSMLVNQNVETFVVSNQGALGTCKLILATLSGWPANGWYCPAGGRIHFIRKNAGVPIKVFDGIVADRVVGSPDRIGGTYASDYAPTQAFGYYSFSGLK
jgi:hypothetical protein